MVIWLIGLAGAGKTSIGRAMHARMRARNPASVFLDGDMLRRIMGHDLGHTIDDRRANGWRLCRLCQVLDVQGLDVICAVLSLFHDQQAWNRENYSAYFEVFIDVPLEVLEARDHKGLYSGAGDGRVENVVGVDLAFAPPLHPDLVLRNDRPRDDFGPLAEEILAALAAAGDPADKA